MALVPFPATRWSLIARLPGQPTQAAVLVGLYADAIGEYLARKLAGERRELVEDIVQEVLLDLLARPEVLAQAKPGPDSRFRHFLMSLAWGSARNALRRARRQSATRIEDEPAVSAPDPAMDRAWALSVVQQALDELRRWSQDGTLEPESFAVLHASLVETKGLREIAATLGISLATCSRRLAGARTMLQKAIAERLRLAGELGPDEDPGQACEVLLKALATA